MTEGTDHAGAFPAPDEEVRAGFEQMFDRFCGLGTMVPPLSEYIAADDDLSVVPDLDRLARLILLPRRFETPEGRLSLVAQLWMEGEADRDDTIEGERRLLWAIEGLLYDDVADRFAAALPPATVAHIDQMIALHRAEFEGEQ